MPCVNNRCGETIYKLDHKLVDALCLPCTTIEENNISVLPTLKAFWEKYKDD